MAIVRDIMPQFELFQPASTEDALELLARYGTGAWVLAGFIQQYGPVWRAVGAYGVGNDRKKDAARQKYAQLVASALARIEGHAQTSPGASLLGNSTTHMAGGESAQTRAASGMQVID